MQTSSLLVSSDVPHLILAVETSLQHLLGYAPHELVGKDFRILQGPETDTERLTSSMDHANATQNQFILYERHGLAVPMDVSCEPYFSMSQNKVCTLMGLAATELNSRQFCHAWGDAAFPHALAAECPNRIEVTNQQSSEVVGVAEQHVVYPRPNRSQSASLTGSCWNEPFTDSLHANHAASPVAARVLPWLASTVSQPAGEGSSAAIATRDRRRGATPPIMDEGYVRRLRRRYQAAARRAGAPKARAAGRSAVGAPPARQPCSPLARQAPPSPPACRPSAPPELRSSGTSRASSLAPPSPPSPTPSTPQLVPACGDSCEGWSGEGGECCGGWACLDCVAAPLTAWLDAA